MRWILHVDLMRHAPTAMDGMQPESRIILVSTSTTRFPRRHEVVPVFATCAVPVFSWTIFWFLHRMPGWLPFLAPWRILGIFAYTQAFALLESLSILLVLILMAAILPVRLFRRKFVAVGTALMMSAALWIACGQIILIDNPNRLPLWAALALAFTLLSCVLVHRYPRLEQFLSSLADRLTVFLYLYVPLGLLGLVVVVSRNLL